ncbi:MAG: GH25 family lysozyme, partial [Oscillospiraceae bacterium]|nr:GH25 family lysozyme [Oscillospiraceae bacterium]
GTHDILISSELIDKLEQLHASFNCSKIIVTSGYRCPTHDKNVGGTSTGQHTKGTAADICCYAQDGSIISSKLVCCRAQDLGFTGIANIDSSYQYTHVDVRTSYPWYGDETKGTSTVTDDFYKYYGISKNTDSEKDSGIFGIDVSEHQDNINWSHVKTDGVKFAIIRAGYGKELSQKDSQFENNYAGCKSNSVPCGVYWFSYAESVEEAKQEAQVCLKTIAGKTFEYPIYFDLENPYDSNGNVIYRLEKLGKKACSDIVQAFCDEIEKAGYYAGLYCSTDYLNGYVSESVRSRYTIWCADYRGSCGYTGDYGIWQPGTGTIYGIDTEVDLDYAYQDYPNIIKNAGLNGFSGQNSSIENTDTEKDTLDTENDTDTLEQILEHVANIDKKLQL